MLGKAFCGNGFIHLNVAEIYEEDVGGHEKYAPIDNQGSKWRSSATNAIGRLDFLKRECFDRAFVSRNRKYEYPAREVRSFGFAI